MGASQARGSGEQIVGGGLFAGFWETTELTHEKKVVRESKDMNENGTEKLSGVGRTAYMFKKEDKNEKTDFKVLQWWSVYYH